MDRSIDGPGGLDHTLRIQHPGYVLLSHHVGASLILETASDVATVKPGLHPLTSLGCIQNQELRHDDSTTHIRDLNSEGGGSIPQAPSILRSMLGTREVSQRIPLIPTYLSLRAAAGRTPALALF